MMHRKLTVTLICLAGLLVLLGLLGCTEGAVEVSGPIGPVNVGLPAEIPDLEGPVIPLATERIGVFDVDGRGVTSWNGGDWTIYTDTGTVQTFGIDGATGALTNTTSAVFTGTVAVTGTTSLYGSVQLGAAQNYPATALQESRIITGNTGTVTTGTLVINTGLTDIDSVLAVAQTAPVTVGVDLLTAQGNGGMITITCFITGLTACPHNVSTAWYAIGG